MDFLPKPFFSQEKLCRDFFFSFVFTHEIKKIQFPGKMWLPSNLLFHSVSHIIFSRFFFIRFHALENILFPFLSGDFIFPRRNLVFSVKKNILNFLFHWVSQMAKKKELNLIFKKNSPGKRKKNHSLSENIFQEKFGSHSKTFFHWISHTKKNKFSFHLVSRIRKNKIFCEK